MNTKKSVPKSGASIGWPVTEPLLILGLGNLICADDGLGVAAVHRLLELYEPGPGVRVLDGGTLGLSLLPYLEDAERVILVDAIADESPPGSFVRLAGEEVAPAMAARLSVHQVGVSDLLDGARWRERLPRKLVLLGIVPESLELSTERTPGVEQRIPELVEQIVEEVRGLGFELRPREVHVPYPDFPVLDGAGVGGGL
jgi:hydrogenase maturation protease